MYQLLRQNEGERENNLSHAAGVPHTDAEMGESQREDGREASAVRARV